MNQMTEVHEICADILNERVSKARDLMDSASECLFKCDYLQAAVRLESLKELGAFTQAELRVFDVASRDAILNKP